MGYFFIKGGLFPLIHIIWGLLLVVGVLAGVYEGNLEQVSEAVFDGAEEATKLCLLLLGGMAFWLGLMRLAEEAGILGVLQRYMRPLIKRLFPSIPIKDPAHSYIASIMVANLFGLAGAATPIGLKAMHRLQELNPDKTRATPAMCTLSSLVTSGFTLIPVFILILRAQCHSEDPAAIIVPSLVAAFISTIAALFLDWLFRRCTVSRPFPDCSHESKS